MQKIRVPDRYEIRNNFMYPTQFPSNIYNIYGVSVKQLKLPIFDVKCNLSAQEEDWRVGEWFPGS